MNLSGQFFGVGADHHESTSIPRSQSRSFEGSTTESSYIWTADWILSYKLCSGGVSL